MDEFDLIARYFAPLATAPGAFGLKDDAAAIPARPGFDLVVTTDQIAAGTDFFPDDPADSVARKALRVNLSDLAAKGAKPAYYLLNLALPRPPREEWLAEFARGLSEDQRQFGISLLGGDTSAMQGPLSISVTAMGFVPEGRMVKRSGAKAGDAVYVTGTIGDSGGGLALLKGEGIDLGETDRAYLLGRYRVPQPPVIFGAGLCDIAHAGVDVSDGLIADLAHVAKGSGVAIEIDASAIPLSDALRGLWGDGPEAILRAAAAGDDYQIAFTAEPVRDADICAAAERTGVSVSRIGVVKPGKGLAVRHGDEILTVPETGYRHF